MAIGRVVGRPGLEPATTGLKVHWECNGDRGFQHPPNPVEKVQSTSPDGGISTTIGPCFTFQKKFT